MQQVIESTLELYKNWRGKDAASIDVLPRSGSERRYFRIHEEDDTTIIGTYGANIKENETFFYFSEKFFKQQLPVANIHAISDDRMFYLQEDFGDISLIDRLESEGYTNEIYGLFQKSLQTLATLHVKGDEELDYDRCLTNTEFGRQAIMADLLYFKYYFLDALRKPYDKQKLIDDFEALSNYLTHTEYKYFMFRDFQSRNIMVKKDNSIHFIDYQGGMKGAPQYDVASMLWQARANLSDEWKEKLLNDYISALENIVGSKINKGTFKSQYNGYVMIRLLQVMGAYGFRGLFERKAHFLASIPLALRNLRFFIDHKRIGIVTPEFDRVLRLVVTDEMIKRFEPMQADEKTPLLIEINSFSYKKGIPPDPSENGGGFVFDMRGILNPGRFDEYKTLTGKEKPVQDFLEQRTKMNEFLNSVWDLIDITVEEYLRRGFDHLMINFGCTGGQHRSVYAAEQTARHLRNKFKVKVQLEHTNSENWRREL